MTSDHIPKSFEDWKRTPLGMKNGTQRAAFAAGVASQQVEIEQLNLEWSWERAKSAALWAAVEAARELLDSPNDAEIAVEYRFRLRAALAPLEEFDAGINRRRLLDEMTADAQDLPGGYQ